MKTNLWRLCLVAAMLAGAFNFSARAQLELTNGLVAYYPLAGNANDTSGNGLNGNPFNVTYTTNRFGLATNAVLLEGNSFVAVNYVTNFDFSPTGEFTLSAWFKFNGFGNGSGGIGSLIVKGPSTGAWDFGLECSYENEHVLWAGLNYEWPCVSTNKLAIGNWYQGVLTYSNALWRLYLDGTLLVTTNSSYKITQSTGGISIGRKGDDSADYFDGAISDVRIYNREFATNEVKLLYQYESVYQQPSSAALALQLTTTNLVIGGRYQTQISTDLAAWSNYGPPFIATSTNLSQSFNLQRPREFYRLVAAP